MKFAEYIVLTAAAVMGLAGCLRDAHELPDGQNGDTVAVELTVAFEDEGQVVTRALTADQEDYVDNIDVLVFEYNDVEGDGKGTFLYSTHGVDIKNTNGSRAKTFKAMLATTVKDGATEISLTGRNVFLLVLANARGIWNSASVSYGDSFRSVVNQLIYDAPGNWDASATSTQYFPMASIPSARAEIREGMNGSDFGTIQLVRAVMAINVGFNYDVGGTPLGFDNFKLEQVVLCKFPDKGYVSGYYGYSNTFSSRVPSTGALVTRTYTVDPTSRYGIFNEIYMPLAMAANISLGQYPYLLVGGYYSADGTVNTDDLTWYRIDLPTVMVTSGGNTYECSMYMERNYKYTFQVQSVSGPGYASREEATTGGPNMWANMTVVPWSESNVNTDIDGPYYFDISQKEFYLDNSSRLDATHGDNILSLCTDYSGGWQVDGITYEEDPGSNLWLSTDILGGAPFVLKDMLILATANYTDNGRVGYIHLSAGRWKYTVRVQQGEMSNLAVTPASRTISFWSHRNGAMDTNTFAVESDYPWTISGITYPVENWGLTAYPTSDGKGFYVQCDRNSTTNVRNVIVKITSGGRTVSVPITQDWADCGIGGVTVSHHYFGGNYVQTHILGGNPREIERLIIEKGRELPYAEWPQDQKDGYENMVRLYPHGEMYACWMVENAYAGTFSEEFYDSDIAKRGPYYGKDNLASACPVGWRVPQFEDLMGMIQLYGVARLGDSYYSTDDILAWDAWMRSGDALAGGCFTGKSWNDAEQKYDENENLLEWKNWGTAGYYYSDFDGFVEGGEQIVHPMVAVEVMVDSSSPVGYGAHIGSEFSDYSLFPVRCVMDREFHYE